MNAAISREIRELHVSAVDRALHRRNAKIVLLELVLVEQRRIEAGDAEGGEVRRQAWGVGNLEACVRGAGDEGEPRIGVEQGRDVAEPSLLLGVVVDGVPARRRILGSAGRR